MAKQFGFRSNYSTYHALISITEGIKYLIDSGNYVCGVFVDLEKAFGIVNHSILCEKLKYDGLHGNVNNLIKSYLANRKQFVSINGFDSELGHLLCGVPRVLLWGHLIYINDFRACLNNAQSGHSIDDTYIMFGSEKLTTIETVVNYELSKWLILNKLSSNALKTKLIFFHSKIKFQLSSMD